MAVQSDDHGNVVVTGEHIHMVRRMQIASALGLEITTGMKFSRGSMMQMAARECGSAKRTKKGVLTDYVKWMHAQYPQYRPAPSVAKALGK